MKIQNKKIELRKEKESTETKDAAAVKELLFFYLNHFIYFVFLFLLVKMHFLAITNEKKCYN